MLLKKKPEEKPNWTWNNIEDEPGRRLFSDSQSLMVSQTSLDPISSDWFVHNDSYNVPLVTHDLQPVNLWPHQ